MTNIVQEGLVGDVLGMWLGETGNCVHPKAVLKVVRSETPGAVCKIVLTEDGFWGLAEFDLPQSTAHELVDRLTEALGEGERCES